MRRKFSSSLDAWSTAAALAAVTERIELMVAVRPQPFICLRSWHKQAANIDHISNGRLTLNVSALRGGPAKLGNTV